MRSWPDGRAEGMGGAEGQRHESLVLEYELKPKGTEGRRRSETVLFEIIWNRSLIYVTSHMKEAIKPMSIGGQWGTECAVLIEWPSIPSA